MLLPLQCKTLIVAGDHDTVVPLHIIKQFYEKAYQSFHESELPVHLYSPSYLELSGVDHFQVRLDFRFITVFVDVTDKYSY